MNRSTNLSGSWQPVTGATSPYTAPMTAARMFFFKVQVAP